MAQQPQYIKTGNTEMRYDSLFDNYYRERGGRSVGYKYIDGKFYSVHSYPWLNNIELKEICYMEWKLNDCSNKEQEEILNYFNSLSQNGI